MTGRLEEGDYPAAVVDAPDQPQTDEPFGPPSVQIPAVIPPVVVVVVAHDPGEWFTDTLASLAGQTYPNTSILVIDTASAQDLAPVIAEAAPGAHLRRLEQNVGFGPAANEVLTAVEGASFYLFCHDDVRLEPDAVQIMVEEAFRSNAGMVGAKVVEWDEPMHILQVGMGADKTGAPAPLVERGELDQEQHDAVRDVFYIPGAATLVRGDLFTALGGYDPGIELLGEDLDLSVARPTCWGLGCWWPPEPASPTSRPWASAVRWTTVAGSRCATGCAPARSATRPGRACGCCPRPPSSPWPSSCSG